VDISAGALKANQQEQTREVTLRNERPPMTTDKPLLLECPLVQQWRTFADLSRVAAAPYAAHTEELAIFKSEAARADICADELESWLTSREAVLDVYAVIKSWREKRGGPWLESDPIEAFQLLNEIENEGFELAHELRPCGHSRGDYRDAGYIPGKSETYTASEQCVGCEREAVWKEVVEALVKLKPHVWEATFEEKLETDYERAVVRVYAALSKLQAISATSTTSQKEQL
jgi:hypothetical protein